MSCALDLTLSRCLLKRLAVFAVSCVLLASCAKSVVEPPRTIPPVKAFAAVRSDATRELRLSGSLGADRMTSVSFPVPGTVEEVLVQEGQVVEAGQILAKLSPRMFQDALAMAKASAGQADDAFRRLEPMYKNQTLPEVKMVEVETGREQARISVSMAKRNLDDTVLRARQVGVVARRHVDPGANVMPGMSVVTIAQTKTMLASAPVPENQISKVKVGTAAKVTVAALKKTFEGTVRDIAVIADPLTRTYEVKVALPNDSDDLRVGMVAEIRLVLPGEPDAVVVPPEAVRVNEAGAPCVFVVVGTNMLQRRPVEVSGYAGEGIAISKGLSEGELVVTSGTPMLADGMTVRLVAPDAEVVAQ